MSLSLVYVQGASQPDALIDWPDQNGNPVDFGGVTFTGRIGKAANTARAVKTTGITGSSDFPNVTIVWDDELDDLPAGSWTLTLVSSDGRKRNVGLVIQPEVRDAG